MGQLHNEALKQSRRFAPRSLNVSALGSDKWVGENERRKLQSLQKGVVIGVGADPEPNPILIPTGGKGAVVNRDSGREDRFIGMDLLELKARMYRILGEQVERLAGPLLDVAG